MKKIDRKTFFLLAGSIFSCAPIPYPHDAYQNSNVSGKVVDAATKVALQDIAVRIGEEKVLTDTNGVFNFTPKKERMRFMVFPLIQIDPDTRCIGKIVVNGMGSDGYNPEYRELSLNVNSCRYTRVIPNHSKKNQSLRDDVGVVFLVRKSAP